MVVTHAPVVPRREPKLSTKSSDKASASPVPFQMVTSLFQRNEVPFHLGAVAKWPSSFSSAQKHNKMSLKEWIELNLHLVRCPKTVRDEMKDYIPRYTKNSPISKLPFHWVFNPLPLGLVLARELDLIWVRHASRSRKTEGRAIERSDATSKVWAFTVCTSGGLWDAAKQTKLHKITIG